MDKVTLIHIASEACVWLGTVFFLQKEINSLQSDVRELKNTVNQLVTAATASHSSHDNRFLPPPPPTGFGGMPGFPQGHPRSSVGSSSEPPTAQKQLTEEEYAEYIRHMQRMRQQRGTSSDSKMKEKANHTQDDELDNTLQELGEMED